MKFEKWLDTFIDEKRINVEEVLEIKGNSGTNYIPVACIIEKIKSTSKYEKIKIKNILVVIDFKNGDVLHFFNHLAKVMAM